MGTLFFITGGARSGKSAFAERLAAREAERSGAPVVYLATMEPLDDELRERVARHRAARPPAWTTVEAPLALREAVEAAPAHACLLVDCLSLWVTNRLLAVAGGGPLAPGVADTLERALVDDLDAIAAATRARAGAAILVTNEVGSGVVPPYPLGRVYRDLLGRINQRASAAAGSAWLLVAGRALPLPSPGLPED